MLINSPVVDQIEVVLRVNDIPCEHVVLSSPGNCPVDAPLDVSLNTHAIRDGARRYNGLYELLFLLELEGDSLEGPETKRIVGHAVLPTGESHYLGPLMPSGNPVSSAVLVEDVPETLQVRFSIDTDVPEDVVPALPAEILLADHVAAIIDNDDLSGSLASSHVQNLVRELPFYKSGMKRFKNWTYFVRFFADSYRSWAIVEYTEEEHNELGFSNLMLVGEMRLVSNHFLTSYKRADKVRDLVRQEAFLEFQRLLLSFVGQYDCSRRSPRLSGDAFKKLGESRSFRTLNSANYVRILRIVALDPERYVLFDPFHPIRIDWRRSDLTTPGIAIL